MKKSVARQEQIASQYQRSAHQNFAAAEAQKDKRIEQINSLNEQKKDATLTNALQGESFKRQSDNDALKKDLMQQINQKREQS